MDCINVLGHFMKYKCYYKILQQLLKDYASCVEILVTGCAEALCMQLTFQLLQDPCLGQHYFQ
jgi:hypothetical protein